MKILEIEFGIWLGGLNLNVAEGGGMGGSY